VILVGTYKQGSAETVKAPFLRPFCGSFQTHPVTDGAATLSRIWRKRRACGPETEFRGCFADKRTEAVFIVGSARKVHIPGVAQKRIPAFPVFRKGVNVGIEPVKFRPYSFFRQSGGALYGTGSAAAMKEHFHIFVSHRSSALAN
jgi:hypothetical protein